MEEGQELVLIWECGGFSVRPSALPALPRP